jgi:hypothetical protein
MTDDLKPIDIAESVMDIPTAEKGEKLLINGTLYIRRGDVWYNIMGTRVK